MEMWYTEEQTNNVRFSIRCDKQKYSAQSDFQRIEIFSTPEFGDILVLDDRIMLTQKDEFIYHEMISHVPMAVNPDIKNVLVIGAGDGGTVRELTKYKSIEKIDMVEIDRMVVDACKEFLPTVASKLNDHRVHIFIDDGLRFVRHVENKYDLIIVDSTDPFGPGEGLFTTEFYGNCYKALTSDGILVNQHESPFYNTYSKSMKQAHKKILQFFPIVKVYQAHIPTYPSGHWLFGFASKKFHPVNDLDVGKWNRIGIDTDYYNTRLHKGCFALPTYVTKQLLENE
ncbi:MAG: polyamine aminopropyltransferase [Clostridia bacterium]|nr:polyamine aminopropyltransferase [Clostridia bacterium]